ncbi:hypothetical protein PG994_007489 [Apiospora phragmitis]|uniref:DUF7492 domain-containing protein n=1 Tax=Apiospora phragmitis TaxID=2905665 RepID=A0ABR1V3F5_9PEZI
MSVLNFTQVLVLLTLVQAAISHSWIERVFRMNSDGSFADNTGYALGFMPRDAFGYSDENVQNKILDPSSNPLVCRQFPQGDYLNSSYGPLQAAAGDYVALTYEENGHVTDPGLTSRPYRGGLTYVYGTLQQKAGDKLNDVQKWNADQTGGNKKGKLLATHYYDDLQCYQKKGLLDGPTFPIYMERHGKYNVDELDCQTDVQLPKDLPESGTYTLYWVWDWPQKPNEVGTVPEMYTSCIEIKLGPASAKASAMKQGIKFAKQGKVDNMGIASQVNHMIEAATLESYLPSPTGANGIKTVTVTAAPTTVTQYRTVMAGNGAQQTGPATASTLQTSVRSGSSAAAPTNNVPVSSVTPFLKVRATGKARRDAGAQ